MFSGLNYINPLWKKCEKNKAEMSLRPVKRKERKNEMKKNRNKKNVYTSMFGRMLNEDKKQPAACCKHKIQTHTLENRHLKLSKSSRTLEGHTKTTTEIKRKLIVCTRLFVRSFKLV